MPTGLVDKLLGKGEEPKKDEPKKDEPKKDEPKKDEPKKDEPSQDALNWKVNLPDELKKHTLEFDTQEDFVRDYVKQKMIAGDKVSKFSGKDLSDLKQYNKEVYGELKYEEGDKELGESLGLHPFQMPSIKEELNKRFVEEQKHKKEEQLAKNRNDIVKHFSDTEELDHNLGAVMHSMGVDSNKFQELLGEKLYDLEVMKTLNSMGDRLRSEPGVKIKEGKDTGNLPDDMKTLKDMLLHYNQKLINSESEILREQYSKKKEDIRNKIRSVSRVQQKKTIFRKKRNKSKLNRRK